MMLLSGVAQDLTLQHMQGECASQIFIPTKKLNISLLEVEWSKAKAKFQNMPSWGTTYKFDWPKRIIQGTKSYLYVFKIIQKPKFLSRDRVRFESKLFYFLIAQDILVDTWKFTGSDEARNNLYADFQIKEMNPLSP